MSTWFTTGRGMALGVMCHDEVDARLAVPVEGVCEQDLADLHVDPDDDFLHFSFRTSMQDPGV